MREMISDYRLTDEGKIHMLKVIEDPKIATSYVDDGWARYEMERLFYERLRENPCDAENCFVKPVKPKENKQKADESEVKQEEGVNKR